MGVGGQSVAMDQLLVILLAASVAAQDYGPVSLDSVDALTLNWNQIQWLVKDQIKEVEELREEHNELYNEITRCFGNEKCLAEFELLDMSPGSKLHGLGLRALDLSGSAMSRMREEVLQTKSRLDMEMRERWTMDKDQGRPGQTCCSRRGTGSCRSQESLLLLLILLVLIFIFRIKRFIFDILKRGLLILVILVNLFLLILARFRRWTSAGSNVLWSELTNKQRQWATLLQCQHHLRTNPHCL